MVMQISLNNELIELKDLTTEQVRDIAIYMADHPNTIGKMQVATHVAECILERRIRERKATEIE